jgi:hypothetical protein
METTLVAMSSTRLVAGDAIEMGAVDPAARAMVGDDGQDAASATAAMPSFVAAS